MDYTLTEKELPYWRETLLTFFEILIDQTIYLEYHPMLREIAKQPHVITIHNLFLH